MSPEDWLAAMALGYLEGRAGELGGEAEEPAVPGLTGREFLVGIRMT
jgi:hypothetical protein